MRTKRPVVVLGGIAMTAAGLAFVSLSGCASGSNDGVSDGPGGGTNSAPDAGFGAPNESCNEAAGCPDGSQCVAVVQGEVTKYVCQALPADAGMPRADSGTYPTTDSGMPEPDAGSLGPRAADAGCTQGFFSANYDASTTANVPMGTAVDVTATISANMATPVTPRLASTDFQYKGGPYPGTGGTCGSVISGTCTIVLTYHAVAHCAETATISLNACSSPITLEGNAIGIPAQSTCGTNTVLYVSTSGNDSDDGLSPTSAKQSISGALAAAPAPGRLTGYEIRIAEGTYSESVTLPGAPACVKLFGGYDSTFQQHDPVAHVSRIEGGVVNATVALLDAEGLTIVNPAGDAIDSDPGPVIVRNDILQGAKAFEIGQSSCGVVQNNQLTGPSYYWQSNTEIVANVFLAPGAIALSIWQSSASVTGNSFSGAQGLESWQNGAVSSQWGPMTVARNKISGSADGVDSFENFGVTYENNLIYGGSFGIDESTDGKTTTYASNTVVSSGTLLADESGEGGEPGSIWVNNLLVSLGANSVGYSYLGLPASLQNNVFDSVSTAGDNQVGTTETIAGLNALGSNTNSGGNAVSTVAPTSIFVNLAGPDGDPSTLGDNDWHLATTDPTIRGGGHDPTAFDCGYVSQPMSCGSASTDFDGVTRTAPYPVGAYQQ